jgi:molybdopterin-guanine dinucleotide biosynthesis protein A
MSSLISVVVCQAGSSIKGKDKCLIKSGTKTLAEIAFEKLKEITEKVYVSVNQFQFDKYSEIFPDDVLLQNKVEEKGPLAGLFTLYKKMPSKDIFMLSGDLPKIDIATLRKIQAVYKINKNLYDFFVYKKQLNIEPFAGIYTRRGLEHIYKTHYSGNMPKASLKFILQSSNTYAIKIRDRDKLTGDSQK